MELGSGHFSRHARPITPLMAIMVLLLKGYSNRADAESWIQQIPTAGSQGECVSPVGVSDHQCAAQQDGMKQRPPRPAREQARVVLSTSSEDPNTGNREMALPHRQVYEAQHVDQSAVIPADGCVEMERHMLTGEGLEKDLLHHIHVEGPANERNTDVCSNAQATEMDNPSELRQQKVCIQAPYALCFASCY